MSRRFSFFDSPDELILKHADSIKLHLLRCDDGRLAMEFTITGTAYPDEKADMTGDDPTDIARYLFEKFISTAMNGGVE